jgi:hypothetical protein
MLESMPALDLEAFNETPFAQWLIQIEFGPSGLARARRETSPLHSAVHAEPIREG